MNDAGCWAKSWFTSLMRDGVPRPLALRDQHSQALKPSQLREQLRELRRPVADGVPKHGRYAVVYEQPWGGQDAVWMEAAEYLYGMFGARFVFVQLVRRGVGGELVAVGDLVELADGRLAELPAQDGAPVREVVGSGVARARQVWAERPQAWRPSVGVGEDLVARTIAGGRVWLRRLAGRPAAVVSAVWIVLVLVGVVSAFSLTGGDDTGTYPQRPSRTAARAVAVPSPAAAPAAQARPPAPNEPAPSAPVRQASASGDLGLPIPISQPTCDGAYGVFVAAAVRPGAYEREVRDFLARYSGASYLLAEQACPSLRAHTGAGNSIYAIYYGPYEALGNACATRVRIGGGSYVRRLDNSGSRSQTVAC